MDFIIQYYSWIAIILLLGISTVQSKKINKLSKDIEELKEKIK